MSQSIDFDTEISRTLNEISTNNMRLLTEKLMPWQESLIHSETVELEHYLKHLKRNKPKTVAR